MLMFPSSEVFVAFLYFTIKIAVGPVSSGWAVCPPDGQNSNRNVCILLFTRPISSGIGLIIFSMSDWKLLKVRKNQLLNKVEAV